MIVIQDARIRICRNRAQLRYVVCKQNELHTPYTSYNKNANTVYAFYTKVMRCDLHFSIIINVNTKRKDATFPVVKQTCV